MDYVHISEHVDRFVKHPELLVAHGRLDRIYVEERARKFADAHSYAELVEEYRKSLVRDCERTLELADKLRHDQDPDLREEGDRLFSEVTNRLNSLKNDN